jgi:hypothetical protein
MSKSVTVIRGRVLTHQSVTRDRNIANGNEVGGGGHGHNEHGHDEHDDSRGVGPDGDGDWDEVVDARTFTRRVKTN